MKKLIRSEKIRPLVVILALALVIALNAAASGLPHLDLSPRRAATPADEAIALARSITERVDLFIIQTEDNRDIWLNELVARFAAANHRLRVQSVDPASSFMEKLSSRAGGQALEEGNILVFSDRRSVVLTAEDLYHYEYDQMAYYYYGTLTYTSADFTAQDALCRALSYVTRDDMPVLYVLSGHGEGGWDNALNALCFRNSIALETLALAPGESVPGDAAAVMVCGPASPVGAETADALLAYLQAGGDMLLMTSYNTDLTDLDRVAAHYGMARRTGLVLDNDAGHIYSADYKYFLRPDLRQNPVTDALIAAGQSVILPVCEAIVRSDTRRAGLNAQPILVTSENAYLKTNTEAVATLDQEEADALGRFIVGMAAVEGDTHFTWLASATALTASTNAASGGANEALVEAVLQRMFDFPERADALPAVSLMTDPVSLPRVPAALILAAAPLICLIVGLIRRRKTA